MLSTDWWGCEMVTKVPSRLWFAVALLIGLLALPSQVLAATALKPLTIAEVAQFQSIAAGVSRLGSNPGAAAGDCRSAKNVSPLLGAVKGLCLDLVSEIQDANKADKAETSCAKRPTTAAVFQCLLPPFQAAAGAYSAGYSASRSTASIATARGFTGGCLKALDAAENQIAAEKQSASAFKAAVNAIKQHSSVALTTAGRLLVKAGKASVAASSDAPLNDCPQQ
jgi:hypothetical protein